MYFDDLTVTHTTGPLLQEQSYYPFGLQMSGISDKAINKLKTQDKFNGGVELEDDYGVNLYSTFYRQYDPQIGRFTGVDILSEATIGLTPYQFGNGNPVTFNDPTGALNQAEFDNIVNSLQSRPYGGSWHAGGSGGEGSTSYFGSDASAFAWGSAYMDLNKSWGSNGFAGSLDAAKTNYYSSGGTDGGRTVGGANYGGGVQGVEPSITVMGRINNGQWNTSGVSYNGFGGSSPRGEGSSFETAHHFLHWSEFVFTAGEVSNASRTFGEFGGEAYWIGKNLKAYSPAWGGNGFTGGRNAVQEFAEGMGKVAHRLGVVTIGISVVQAGVDLYDGNYKAAGIHGLDAVMGAIGTFGGPVGWAVSGAYFISRFWWGNEEEGGKNDE